MKSTCSGSHFVDRLTAFAKHLGYVNYKRITNYVYARYIH